MRGAVVLAGRSARMCGKAAGSRAGRSLLATVAWWCANRAHTIKVKLTVRMNAELPGTAREYRQVGRRP